ncbi:outer membrane protein, ompH family [Flavobacteriales bacterium ALC-1]|nr:outer membrane protein, ompH family [Flavobacteriales bacterium ALC-1]
MKYKVLFLLAIISLMSFSANAQRGVRIGYIDTEYILQNVPEYQEASTQLDKKVLQWKTEIEKRLTEIEQKKKELDNESVLLTKELYDERFEDISFEEAEILDYQQKRFGPNGDLMIQKRQLIEPIQDQIFAAVQDIAETGKYDFVFDKSADVVMLYSAERYDLSERVLKTITRTSKRTQAKNKKERKALQDEAVVPVANAEKDDRQKALEERKTTREAELAAKRAEREKAAEDRKKQQQELRDAKKREAEERRQKALDARKKNSKTSEKANTTAKDTTAKVKTIVKNDSTKVKEAVKKDSTNSKKPKTAAQILEEQRQKKVKDREARKKALDDRKKKILEQRKKARQEREKQVKKNDSIAKAKKQGENN